jgi:hypothetical protein
LKGAPQVARFGPPIDHIVPVEVLGRVLGAIDALAERVAELGERAGAYTGGRRDARA